MKINKLDRRMTGHEHFMFMVKFSATFANLEKFFQIRNWCLTTWGPSCELKYYPYYKISTPVWAWANNEFENRIYFATEKESNWALLAFS